MAMRQRCRNPNNAAYAYYGGRGITICKRWDSYATFLADMGERPAGATLERKRNSRGYSKGNCIWATHLEQQNNTRFNRMVRAFGERKTASEWARDVRCTVSRAALYERLQAGIRPEIAITTPWQRGKHITR
jgi:hypothetical protein